MAYADSAFDYNATIKTVSPAQGRMNVLYETVPADSDRPGLYRTFTMQADDWDSANIRAKIDNAASSVAQQWLNRLNQDQQSGGQSNVDSDFLNKSYTGRYKVSVDSDVAGGAFNRQLFRESDQVTETADTIVTTTVLVALTDSEKTSYRSTVSATKDYLMRKLHRDGHIDSVEVAMGLGEPISASWDGSPAASFNWDSHQIASRGIRTVTRQSEGIFRVFFSTPMTDSNYTVITAVGADDYSGTGSSPRTLAVLRDEDHVTPEYFTVVCERADDAVNEDNAYFSVLVPHPKATDSAEVVFENATGISFDDVASTRIKNILGYNDSDWASYLLLATEG